MRKILSLLLALLSCNAVAQTTLTDNDLRKLFIITGTSAISTPNRYGGVVLFKSFFEIYGNACSLKKHYNTTIFIDEEGGSVVRIPSANTPSPLQSKKMDTVNFYSGVEYSAKKLKESCVDVNLAPFVEASKYTTRSYSSQTNEVIEKASVFSRAMQSQGIKTVVKHFPAWNQNCESIYNIDSLKLTLKPKSEVLKCSLHDSDKVLFEEKAKVFVSVPSNAVMISNNVIPELGQYPNTMNPKIRDILRKDLGYKNVLISDALWEIQASPKAVLMALKVVDWVMVGEADDAEKAIPAIRTAINEGELTEEEISEKIRLIESFKQGIQE